MQINEEIKKKIIKNKIISEENLLKCSEVYILLAAEILDFIEAEGNDEEELSAYEKDQFNKEYAELADKMELREFDKVKTEEEKIMEMQAIPMRIPAGFVRFIRDEIFPKMRENLDN